MTAFAVRQAPATVYAHINLHNLLEGNGSNVLVYKLRSRDNRTLLPFLAYGLVQSFLLSTIAQLFSSNRPITGSIQLQRCDIITALPKGI